MPPVYGNPSNTTALVVSLNIVLIRPRNSFVSLAGLRTATRVFQTLSLVNGVGRVGWGHVNVPVTESNLNKATLSIRRWPPEHQDKTAVLPEDDDAAAAGGRRRGASSRRRSKAPDGGGKSLPGKLALLKSAATSIMAANAVQRVFGGAGEPPAEELRASSSLLEREADANLGEADGDGISAPPVGPPRTPESLIC